VKYGVENMRVNATYDSMFRIQQVSMGTNYIAHSFNTDVELVRVSKDQIVFSFSADIEVEVVGEYAFLKRDPIDKEYFPIGSRKVFTTEEIASDLLATFVGDFSKGLDETHLHKVEFIETMISVDFGELDFDPDMGDLYG
jgi:hypothetical protein